MFKPMLAAKAGDVNELTYPMLASPKLDGVRCLILNERPYSRNLKLIPNKAVQDVLGGMPAMDGELIVGPPTAKNAFQATSSGVMSVEGDPEFRFYVFDVILRQPMPFNERNALAKAWAASCGNEAIKWLPHKLVKNARELMGFEENMLAEGYEGVMLRSLDGQYKQGRATTREGTLLKVKRFEDSEADVLGFEEKMHNDNELTQDELGRAKRSSHKAGKRPAGVLGALRVRDRSTKVEFDVGAGFTDALRETLWAARLGLSGRIIKYRFQPTGVKDKPRFPVFLGFRDERDL